MTPASGFHAPAPGRRLAAVTAAAAAAVTAVAVVVLAGWTFDLQRLRGPIPGLIEMKANTAIALLAAAAALGLLRRGRPTGGRRLLLFACLAVAVAIGGVSLAEYLVGRTLGINELFFEHPPDAGPTVHPGRLAPQTAVNLLLVSAGMVLLDARGAVRRAAGQAAVLLAGVVSLFAVIGYAYSAGPLSELPHSSPIALHTALAFLALVAGLLCARPGVGVVALLASQAPGSVMARRLLAAVGVSLPVLGWLRLAGQDAGLYGTADGLALYVVSTLAIFAAIIVWTAAALNRAERRRREAARDSERLAAIVEHSDDAILSKSRDGTIISWNGAAQRLYGYPAEEAVGQPISTIIPPHRAGEEWAILDSVLRGTPIKHYDTERLRRDGGVVEVSLSVSPIRDEDGEIVGASTIARDVTERKRAEQAVQEAREEAERANSAKSEFLSRMSHELRTPLTAILGFGELLEMGGLDARQQQGVDQILRGGRHLLDLINELLDISRIESGNMTMSVEPVHLGSALSDALALIRPLAAERSIALRTEVGALEDRWVSADLQRLKQVLLNLLSNAVKYNRERGTVTVALDEPAAHRVRLAVTDTGPGISADELDRLFQPFERLSAEQDGIDGTGLGLVLCKGLTEAMGGTIDVESTPGQGTTFAIELPLSPPPHQTPLGEEAPPRSVGARTTLDGRSVLYIEDNMANFRLVEEILSGRHIDLAHGVNGREGLELALRHTPDVILLDLHLPDLHGREVLARLRADERTSRTPVVIVSADATGRDVASLRGLGATAFLTKPLDVDRFVGTIAAALEGPGTDMAPSERTPSPV